MLSILKVRGGRRSTKVFGDKILSRPYKSHGKPQFYYNYSSDMLIVTCLMIVTIALHIPVGWHNFESLKSCC